jgi:hypothetical protein
MAAHDVLGRLLAIWREQDLFARPVGDQAVAVTVGGLTLRRSARRAAMTV